MLCALVRRWCPICNKPNGCACWDTFPNFSFELDWYSPLESLGRSDYRSESWPRLARNVSQPCEYDSNVPLKKEQLSLFYPDLSPGYGYTSCNVSATRLHRRVR